MGQTAVNRPALQSVVPTSGTTPEPVILLEKMAQALGQHFDVPLPVPELISPNGEIDVKNGKQFSVGLLENPGDHIWSGEGYRRLCASARLTIAGSLFLWRKTLPSSAASAREHESRVTAEETPLPAGYIEHIVRVVEECFPVGWDRGYCEYVERSVPTVKSVRSMGRSKGGWRATGPDRFAYGQACMGEIAMPEEAFKVRFMNAQCDGKSRAVTVMDSGAQSLKPLHKLIYDQISKFPWLCRGEAKPRIFRDFQKVAGEVFVSGDYESASDHLPVTSAEWLLRAIFRRCRFVPLQVQIDALKYLRVLVEYDDHCALATRQLMGSLLCFPLLCLQNYVAFRWIFGVQTPVKINGDDIVFRSSREDYEKWAAFVGSVGLRLSVGKTMVSTSCFSLNSTFFYVTSDRVRLVPVVRCTSLLLAKSPYPGSLAGSYVRFLKGFTGDLRERLGSLFLSMKGALIRKSGRSVVRGLRIPATEKELKSSNLWFRELWYVNSVPGRYSYVGVEDEGLPLPQAPDRLLGQVSIPEGWVQKDLPTCPRKRAKLLEDEKLFWEVITDRAWGESYSPRTLEKEFWAKVTLSGWEDRWCDWLRSGKPTLCKLPCLRTGGRDRLCKQCVQNKFTSMLEGKVRSKLKTKNLYRVLNRQHKRGSKRVWVFQPEEVLYSVPREGPVLYAPAWEVLYETAEHRRWSRLEGAADWFIQ